MLMFKASGSVPVCSTSDLQAASCSSYDICHCYPGLAVFAWLSLVLYKANEALRKQVALKADYNRLHCISLAGLLMCHVPVVLLCLRSEHLWQRFVLRDPSPVPLVRSACSAASCGLVAELFCFTLHAAPEQTSQSKRFYYCSSGQLSFG